MADGQEHPHIPAVRQAQKEAQNGKTWGAVTAQGIERPENQPEPTTNIYNSRD
jgi:hypothetical protein